MNGESEAGLDTHLQSICRATLTPLVRQALGSETVEVTNWDVQQLHGGFAGGHAGASVINRVSGRGRDRDNAVEWSLILKVLYPQPDRDQPSDYDYWRREAHAFESGLLDDLPGHLTAPHCFGVMEQEDGACWIWMEDIHEDIGREWPPEHFGVVARHLGQLNGAYLTGQRSMPSYPWLRRRSYLRDMAVRMSANSARTLAELRNSLDHPMVRRAYPPDVADILSRPWAGDAKSWKLKSTRFLDALDRLPQMLCHNDAFRRNLLARHTPDGLLQTVAIDWAFVGIGWIGWEIDYLVSHPLTNITLDWDEARERDRVAVEGYLEGLRDAGWRGDPRLARLGQTAGKAIIPESPGWLSLLLDESQYARLGVKLGCSVEELADSLREKIRHPLFGYWEEEAWQLLEELDLDS
jgi:hypothetical protein